MQLYAIYGGGELKHYPRVTFNGKGDLPSQGALSNPDDAPLIKDIENKMIDVFGHEIIEIICSKAKEGEVVDLRAKMLRPQHVSSLILAVQKHKVAKLNLGGNELGPWAAVRGAALRGALKDLAYLGL